MIIYAGGFEQLIKDYEKLVFSICFSFAKNYFDAEDLAQETFISAYRSLQLGGFDGINPKAWISKIAVNKCKNYLKSSQRKIYPTEDDVFSALQSTEDSPADYILKK